MLAGKDGFCFNHSPRFEAARPLARLHGGLAASGMVRKEILREKGITADDLDPAALAVRMAKLEVRVAALEAAINNSKRKEETR